jgi:TetR/AcrR family transcriptional repressor of nem operon
MPKPSHRAKILTEGLKVVHARGFVGASVRDIVQAAGVPQGSFTNHFATKEGFGLDVMNLYFENSLEVITRTLRNPSISPFSGLRAYLDAYIDHVGESEHKNGCLLGNFAAEAGDQSELLRLRVVEMFAEIQSAVAECLSAAVVQGELAAETHVGKLAQFVVSSLQGAILLSKAQRDPAPLEDFKDLLFSRVL